VSATLEHVTRLVDGVPTIRDVSLTLEKGTLSVLLGPTLSGKTSIMRLLAGLDKPTTGRVLVDGRDVTGIDVRQRSVAMVYQQFINYPSLTVYENIASPLRVQGRPRAENREARRGGRQAASSRTLISRAHRCSFPAASSSAPRSRGRW
jgi:glycerol transport system ATP-binding protein